MVASRSRSPRRAAPTLGEIAKDAVTAAPAIEKVQEPSVQCPSSAPVANQKAAHYEIAQKIAATKFDRIKEPNVTVPNYAGLTAQLSEYLSPNPPAGY